MGNEGGTEEQGGPAGKKAKLNEEPEDNPEAKKARMSEALAEGLRDGIAATKAHYEQQLQELKAAMSGSTASSSFRVSPAPGGMQG